MANKTNYEINRAKGELIKWVNEKLQKGIPLSVMDIMLENISNQIKIQLIQALIAEEKQQSEEKVEEVETINVEDGTENEDN